MRRDGSVFKDRGDVRYIEHVLGRETKISPPDSHVYRTMRELAASTIIESSLLEV